MSAAELQTVHRDVWYIYCDGTQYANKQSAAFPVLLFATLTQMPKQQGVYVPSQIPPKSDNRFGKCVWIVVWAPKEVSLSLRHLLTIHSQ
jgi:hypothetical protein